MTFDFPKAEGGRIVPNLVDDMWGRFWDNASEDFKACWLAGVEMVSEVEQTAAGLQMKMTTKHPVGVVRYPDGRVTVYVQSGEK